MSNLINEKERLLIEQKILERENKKEVLFSTIELAGILKRGGYPHHPCTYSADILVRTIRTFYPSLGNLIYKKFDTDTDCFIFTTATPMVYSRWDRLKQFFKGI